MGILIRNRILAILDSKVTSHLISMFIHRNNRNPKFAHHNRIHSLNKNH